MSAAPSDRSMLARVKFLSRLALAEHCIADGIAPPVETVAELSDLAIGPMESELDRDLALRSRWDAVFAATDRPEPTPTVSALVRSGVVCPTCADEGETACDCWESVS